jgi:tRNA pseudouridine38-40 synthase
MTKFKAVVEYDGTAYHGWQLQKGPPTIQGEMERVLSRLLDDPIRVHGAGRTDAGVHARGQVAHFTGDWSGSVSALHMACNALLPPDIALTDLQIAPDDFHARHSARSKTYCYRFLNRPLRTPFDRLYAWHIPHALDTDSMALAAGHLLGTHDFSAFGSPTDGTSSTVREIIEARLTKDSAGDILLFSITGTGFLRYMVRSLVGTLVLVGKKKIAPSDFLAILESCDRSRSGPTAPARGLCLMSVHYGDKRNRINPEIQPRDDLTVSPGAIADQTKLTNG